MWLKGKAPNRGELSGPLIFLLPKKKENFMRQNYIMSFHNASAYSNYTGFFSAFMIFFISSELADSCYFF